MSIESAKAFIIGPLPFFRSGGHLPHGSEIVNTLMVHGYEGQLSPSGPTGKLIDLPVTLLQLLDPGILHDLPGRSLIS